jgi:predicted 3-demethylubiquinone-9 3-methyltransferase (glyoxalase superfamily)
MAHLNRITPCLWFDTQAEEAAHFYVGLFPHAAILQISRYGSAGQAIHQKAPGSVMTVLFELDGQRFTALNGGPLFPFNEAISLQVNCATQEEIDHYWEGLGQGGDPSAQQCGWLKDRFGVSWQIVPSVLPSLIADPEDPGAQRAVAAMMQMQKLDIAVLQQAYDG